MVLPVADQNRVKFFHWLKYAHPSLFRAGIDPLMNQATLSGIWDSLSSGITSILTKASEVLPGLADKYVSTKGQLDLLKVNLSNAQQGLPPVTSLQQPNSVYQPQAGGPPPSGGFTDFLASIPPWVKYGALAAAIGAFILARRRRRR